MSICFCSTQVGFRLALPGHPGRSPTREAVLSTTLPPKSQLDTPNILIIRGLVQLPPSRPPPPPPTPLSRFDACCLTSLILIWFVFHRTQHLTGLSVYYLLKNSLYFSNREAHCSNSENLNLGCAPEFLGAFKTVPMRRHHPTFFI